MKKLSLAVALCAASFSFVAEAAPIGDPSGLSGPLTVISFDEWAVHTAGPLTLPGITISMNGDAFSNRVQSQGFAQHPGIFEGQYFGLGVQDFFIDFDGTVAQFGMGVFDPNFVGNVINALDINGNILESITSPSAEFTVGSPGGSHSTFVGFVRSTADIAGIELIAAPGDLMGIDNVTFSPVIASGVPAPGALALLGFGLIGLSWRRRTA